MSRSRVLGLSGAGLGVLAVLFGLWAGWRAWQVDKELNQAVDHAKAARAAVEARDPQRLQQELDALRRSADKASSGTSGTTWSVLTRLPFVGDDATGVRVTSQVLDDLAGRGIAPLLTVTDQVDHLLPKNGSIDLAAFRRLRGPVATADAAFAQADQRLAAQDPSGYVGALDRKFTDFRDEVHSAAVALHAASTATRLLPGLLGDGRPHTYLLAFENNAEVRGAGGLPGAIAYLRADHGTVRIVRQVSASAYPRTAKPVLPLTSAERALYGNLLGTDFRDSTMTPDVPRVADLMRAHSERAFPGTRLDGVVLVDTVTMAYLLDATGPVDVDGVRLTGDDVVDQLLHQTYVRLTPTEQDAFFAAVARTAFTRFTDGAGSPKALLAALARATRERRIAVHLFDRVDQSRLAGSAIAGELGAGASGPSPRVAVTVNDTTGSKMSYYLRWDVAVTAGSCSGGTQQLAGTARLRSLAPKNAATLPAYVTGGGLYGIDPGSQLVAVRVFGPLGGALGGFTVDGKSSHLQVVDDDGRPVGMTFVQLDPGQQVQLGWSMRGGAGQRGATVVTTTPSIEKRASVTTVVSHC